MAIDEKSIYVVDGGDYSIYCLGYTQARAVTNDIMRADPWGGIPFVLRKDLELSLDDRGNVVMSKSTLDKILFLASDELPEGDA
tara:strand:- start:552 stop:803 length:252 start_codon:yes stop_codon:yes gene_type:complete